MYYTRRMPKKKRAKLRGVITVRLATDARRRLAALATSNGDSVGSYIRRVLEHHFRVIDDAARAEACTAADAFSGAPSRVPSSAHPSTPVEIAA
jgi:predicted DNA-binding protein